MKLKELVDALYDSAIKKDLKRFRELEKLFLNKNTPIVNKTEKTNLENTISYYYDCFYQSCQALFNERFKHLKESEILKSIEDKYEITIKMYDKIMFELSSKLINSCENNNMKEYGKLIEELGFQIDNMAENDENFHDYNTILQMCVYYIKEESMGGKNELINLAKTHLSNIKN